MRVVSGYGPTPSAICLIGQRPGKVEVYRGKPFVGPSGEMLADYLLAAGIDKAACYVTNVVRDFNGDDEVTEAEIERDIPELQRELRQCQPRFIGLLGAVAARVILPDVKDLDVGWANGLYFPCWLCTSCGEIYQQSTQQDSGYEQWLLGMDRSNHEGEQRTKSPSLHLRKRASAASASVHVCGLRRNGAKGEGTASHLREHAMRQPDDKEQHAERWPLPGMPSNDDARLGTAKRQTPTGIQQGLPKEEQIPVAAMTLFHPAAGLHRTDLQGRTSWGFEQFSKLVNGKPWAAYFENHQKRYYAEQARVPFGAWADRLIAVDTEGSAKRPWCLSWSGQSGQAFVVRSNNNMVLRSDVENATIICHHSLWDLAVLKAMGITVTRFEDTMLKAALLGVEPHGLKDLARRHLGMRMQTYDGLVAAARRERAINYLGNVIELLNDMETLVGKADSSKAR